MNADSDDCGTTAVASVADRPESDNLLPVIQDAVARGTDPEKLSKMLDIYERWQNNRAQERFGRALEAFQAECPQVPKRRTTEGGKFQFSYASLDDVMKIAQPLLAKNAISLAFDAQHESRDNSTTINVTLRIRVGAYYEDRKFGCPIPKDLSASQPQQWGAALSYAKRYALCAALNIVVTDEDDDAAGVVATISATQMLELEVLIRDTSTNLDKFLRWLNVDSLDVIPAASFAKAKEMLQRKSKLNSEGK
jgi:hypothetical protein